MFEIIIPTAVLITVVVVYGITCIGWSDSPCHLYMENLEGWAFYKACWKLGLRVVWGNITPVLIWGAGVFLFIWSLIRIAIYFNL